MPILVRCICGRELRAADTLAGRRVRCPACRAPVAIPAENGSAVADALVRFDCACGRKMEAHAEHAGKAVRCPDCGDALTVPTPPAQTAWPKAARAGELADQLAVLDARPRKQPLIVARTKRGGRPLLWLGLAAAVLLVFGGGAGTAWVLLTRQAGADADAPITDDLSLAPGDAVLFASLRGAEVMKTELAIKYFDHLAPGQENFILGLNQKLALPLSDVLRVTLVDPDGSGEEAYTIVVTIRTFNRALAVETLVPQATEGKHAGRSYYRNVHDQALWFAGDNVLVIGPPAGVKRSMAQASARPVAGPATPAIAHAAAGSHLVVAYHPSDAVRRRARALLPPVDKELQPLLEARSFNLTADVATTATLDATLAFEDEVATKRAAVALEAGLKKARAWVVLYRMKAVLQGQADDRQALEQLGATLKDLKPVEAGCDIQMQMNADEASLAMLTVATMPALQRLLAAAMPHHFDEDD